MSSSTLEHPYVTKVVFDASTEKKDRTIINYPSHSGSMKQDEQGETQGKH